MVNLNNQFPNTLHNDSRDIDSLHHETTTGAAGTASSGHEVGSSQATVAANGVDLSGLSATDLLTMYSLQLTQIDGQLGGALSDLTGQQNHTTMLGKVADGIRTWRSRNPDSPHHVGDSVDDSTHEMSHVGENDYNVFDIDSPSSPAIVDGNGHTMTWHQALNAAGISDESILPTTEGTRHLYNNQNLEQLSGLISSRQQELGQGSEQRTMKMQQLVSARSQLTQMVTNMLQSMNDATKGILGNLRG